MIIVETGTYWKLQTQRLASLIIVFGFNFTKLDLEPTIYSRNILLILVT